MSAKRPSVAIAEYGKALQPPEKNSGDRRGKRQKPRDAKLVKRHRFLERIGKGHTSPRRHTLDLTKSLAAEAAAAAEAARNAA